MTRTLCTTAVALLMVAARIYAHHAFAAEYDAKKLVLVTGTVTGFTWNNPHVWLYVRVKDQAGTATNWGFEMAGPAGLMRRGWKREDLKKGDRVTVAGFAAKNGPNVANASTITLPDGRKLFGGFLATPGNPFK